MTSPTPILQAEGLTVRFPVARTGLWGRRPLLTAVERVDLALAPGDILGLVGESGCGKSTLARTLLLLQRPSAGTVRFDGADLAALSRRALRPYRRRLQMVFQDPDGSLNPRLTAFQTVAEPLRIHGLAGRRDARKQAAALLERVGLDPSQGNRYPHAFSGGQRQRIGIARAIACRPEVLVADEPVSALDVSVSAQILALLAGLRDEMGMAVLFISHDLATVRAIADRVAVMFLGRIVEQGPVETVFCHPRHPYTRLLLEAVPIPDPRIEASRKRPLLSGEIPSAVDLPPGCPFSGRCPHPGQRCGTERPTLVEVAPGHQVACWSQTEAGPISATTRIVVASLRQNG